MKKQLKLYLRLHLQAKSKTFCRTPNISTNLILKKDLICNHKGLKLLGGHKSWAQKSFGREHFRLNTFH